MHVLSVLFDSKLKLAQQILTTINKFDSKHNKNDAEIFHPKCIKNDSKPQTII